MQRVRALERQSRVTRLARRAAIAAPMLTVIVAACASSGGHPERVHVLGRNYDRGDGTPLTLGEAQRLEPGAVVVVSRGHLINGSAKAQPTVIFVSRRRALLRICAERWAVGPHGSGREPVLLTGHVAEDARPVRYLDTSRRLPVAADNVRLRVAASVAGIPDTTAIPAGNGVVVTEVWRPLWTYLLAIALFPIGLLALLITRSAVLTVEVTATSIGCDVAIRGRGHEAICDAVLSAVSTTPRVSADV